MPTILQKPICALSSAYTMPILESHSMFFLKPILYQITVPKTSYISSFLNLHYAYHTSKKDPQYALPILKSKSMFKNGSVSLSAPASMSRQATLSLRTGSRS